MRSPSLGEPLKQMWNPFVVWERRFSSARRQGDGRGGFRQSKDTEDTSCTASPCLAMGGHPHGRPLPVGSPQGSRSPQPDSEPALCRSLSAGAPFRLAELGSLVAIPAEPGAVPSGGHRAAFWRASMSERLWRFPRTIQIAFFTPHCTMPTLIPIICALAKCTLSDPSPCETLQEESAAPVGC